MFDGLSESFSEDIQSAPSCADTQAREQCALEGDDPSMSLVLDEGVIVAPGNLVLGDRHLPVECTITVEWLRGIEEPTWYGYFMPHHELRMLPGPYYLIIDGAEYRILLRRIPTAIPSAISFWGLGNPPPVYHRMPD